MVAKRRGDGVDCICREIGRAVQRVYEEEWSAEEESTGPRHHRLETAGDCLADGKSFRSFFNDRA